MGRSAKTGAPPLVVEVSAVTGSRHRIKLPAPVADIYRAVAELEKLYPGRQTLTCRKLHAGQCVTFVRESSPKRCLQGSPYRNLTKAPARLKRTSTIDIALVFPISAFRDSCKPKTAPIDAGGWS